MNISRSALALTILIADENADMRLYLRSCLRTMGSVRVLDAADGHAALSLTREIDFDLIISDAQLPGLNGVALCHALKADVATAAIPVLLVSSETRAPPVDCADGFLAKPFNAAGLRASVGHLIPLPT